MLDLNSVHNLVCTESLMSESGINFVWISEDPSSGQKYLVYLSGTEDLDKGTHLVTRDTVGFWEISDYEIVGLKSGILRLWSVMDKPFALFEIDHAQPDLEARSVVYLDSVKALPEDGRPTDDATVLISTE